MAVSRCPAGRSPHEVGARDRRALGLGTAGCPSRRRPPSRSSLVFPASHASAALRLKRARDEASADIEDFRKQRQAESDNFSTSRTAGSQAHVRELQIHTDQEVSKVKKDVELHSAEVVDMLLKHVLNVNTSYTAKME